MNYDFNYQINVDIWSDTLDEKMELIQGMLSEELKDLLKKEINNIINKKLTIR